MSATSTTGCEDIGSHHSVPHSKAPLHSRQHVGKRTLRCEKPAHAVDANPRWCRGRTQVQPALRRAVPGQGRTHHRLTDIHDAHADIATREIGIATLEIRRGRHVTREYAIAKIG